MDHADRTAEVERRRRERKAYVAGPHYRHWQRHRKWTVGRLARDRERFNFEVIQNILTTAIVVAIFGYATAGEHWSDAPEARLQNFAWGMAVFGLFLIMVRLCLLSFVSALRLGFITAIDLAEQCNMPFDAGLARFVSGVLVTCVLGGMIILGAVVGRQAAEREATKTPAIECPRPV